MYGFCVVGMLSLLLGLYLEEELPDNSVSFLKNLRLLSEMVGVFYIPASGVRTLYYSVSSLVTV